MKTTLKISALLFLVAAANAYSLSQLRSLIMEEMDREKRSEGKEITLREHLNNLEKPDEWYREAPEHKRSMESREADPAPAEDCASVCGHPPLLDENATCDSEKWAPEYEQKGDCECLKRYRCCDTKCAEVDLEKCWLNGKKGYMYGRLDQDCCGCPIVQCITCEPPETEEEQCPRGEGAKPTDCYTYTKDYKYKSDAQQCYRSHCEPNSSDAPLDKVCDARCQANKTETSHCLFDYNVCKPSREFENCPRRQKQTAIDLLDPKPLHCYKDPEQVDDEDGGHFYGAESQSCEKCKKWTYEKKSCKDKNVAANEADCHKYGANQLDKKCFTKKMGLDDCGCDTHECLSASPESEPEIFLEKEECPKDHVKVVGTTICMRERHICKSCPPEIEIMKADCPIGEILKDKDCNGCPIWKCEKPSVTKCECGANKLARYAYNEEKNHMDCVCQTIPM